jgi:hypothetical protein
MVIWRKISLSNRVMPYPRNIKDGAYDPLRNRILTPNPTSDQNPAGDALDGDYFCFLYRRRTKNRTWLKNDAGDVYYDDAADPTELNARVRQVDWFPSMQLRTRMRTLDYDRGQQLLPTRSPTLVRGYGRGGSSRWHPIPRHFTHEPMH